MRPVRKDTGYVYCLHDAENNICRIGKTINEDMSRQKQQVGYYAFHLDITTIKVPNYTFCERFVHKALNNYRKKADWFNVTPDMFKEQVELAIADFTVKYEKFKAIEADGGYLASKTRFVSMDIEKAPETKYRSRYKCAYCDKSLCQLPKIKEHMALCLDNPKNKDTCKECKHCESFWKTPKDQFGRVIGNFYGFNCTKHDQKMYTHKAQLWGLPKKYPNSHKGEILMPSDCSDFDDKCIVEFINYPDKKIKEEEVYVPRLDWDAYDRIEINK